MSVMGVPEQVEDEEYEQRLERVAAIDVAKASGKVCTRLPHEVKAGKRVTLVWDVAATPVDLRKNPGIPVVNPCRPATTRLGHAQWLTQG